MHTQETTLEDDHQQQKQFCFLFCFWKVYLADIHCMNNIHYNINCEKRKEGRKDTLKSHIPDLDERSPPALNLVLSTSCNSLQQNVRPNIGIQNHQPIED